MTKTVQFNKPVIAMLLVLPQVIVTLIFFIWPAIEALKESFTRGDAFGIHIRFAGLGNYIALFKDTYYLNSIATTLLFSFAVAFITLALGLLMATLVSRVVKGSGIYKTLLIWPYAVAPAVAGILWRFLFDPAIGIISYVFYQFGINWNYNLHSQQALWLVILTACWQQFSYNFLFFFAGLQAIPQSLMEAASIDGAGKFKRFWSVIFPLLSPITFFLLVINIIYAFFDTFGIIQVITEGGPADATNTLVYKVYNDGFVGLSVGSSSAQSVILMLVVVLLTIIQFRYIERKVHY